MKPKIAMYVSTEDAKSYFPKWRQLFGKYFSHITVYAKPPITLTEVDVKDKDVEWIVCASPEFLTKVLQAHGTVQDKSPSLEKYAGSIFPLRPGSLKKVLVIRNLKSLYTIDYMPFVMGEHLAKIHDRARFLPDIPFTWEEAKVGEESRILDVMSKASLICCDIETINDINWPTQENPKNKRGIKAITESGFAGLFQKDDGSYVIHSVVIPITCYELYSLSKQILELPAAKVMHNGHYDCSYYLRFACPPVNYCYDTYHLQHCFYSELPKTLGFTSALWNYDVQYWKEERGSANRQERMHYNAKDTYYTLLTLLNMMHRASREPDLEYVFQNYWHEFKMVFPALHAGLIGLKVDLVEQARVRQIEEEKAQGLLSRLRKLIGSDLFNPNSSQQVTNLYKLLSYGTATSSDTKEIQTIKNKYPLLEFFADLVEEYRAAMKAISTYYNFELMGDRWLYKIDCAGTETGRCSSKASDFWCGTQIQNVPEYAKSQVIADAGRVLVEIDKSQTEARTTAYLAQDLALIDAVENSPDFHCQNASLFFGIPFPELYREPYHDSEGNYFPGKVLRPDIRKLAKRVNHGANYNMRPGMLLYTMTSQVVYESGRLLNLPMIWTAYRICQYLLGRYDTAYPRVRNEFQQELKAEIKHTGRLVLHDGWTRICFGDPENNRSALNSYVAHKPQSTSVRLVNDSWQEVWLKYQIRPFLRTGKPEIIIHAQIHDSLLLSVETSGTEILAKIDEEMRMPCTIHGRTFVIPNDVSKPACRWSDL